MKSDSTGGIILAGGASRRMGRDKALLCYNGGTIIERAADVIRPLVARIVIVSASPGLYDIEGAETICDIYQGAGPTGGILTGLAALGEGCHVVLACDMPLAQTAVIEYLLQAAQNNPQCDGAAPEIGGSMEPLCAVYRESAVPKLAAFMESGRRSAREALQQLNIITIAESALRAIDPDLESFANINTPEDFERLTPNAKRQTPCKLNK